MKVHWQFKNGEAILGVNHESLAILVNGQMVAVSRMEIDFLITLSRANGRTVTKAHMLQSLYKTEAEESPSSLVTCACRLRRKLAEMHPDAAHFIQTEYGCGYRMVSAAINAPIKRVA